MSEIKVNKITPRTNCGTTTLGDSGDTFTIPAGATISNLGTATGFGGTGVVSWDTSSIKTTGFTAVTGTGYFCNTTSGGFTVTLPASPTAGDVVGVADYAKTFDTDELTLGRNGSLIAGAALDSKISTEGIAVTLVYVDGVKGWIVTDSGLQSDAPGPEYIVACGGDTVLTCGNFKTHVFTNPGTFNVTAVGNPSGSDSVEYLVVGSGGGGNADWSGGSGAGGWRGYTALPAASPLNGPGASPVTIQGYAITVGGGGTGGPGPNGLGSDGNVSTFSTITSAGGGRAGQENNGCGGNPGGSGGGNYYSEQVAGSGNTPPVSPPQGNPGGGSQTNPGNNGYGSGGGAGAAGTRAPACNQSAAGGNGSYVPDGFFGPTAPSYGQSPAPLAPNGRYFAGGASSMSGHPSQPQTCGGAGGGGKGGAGNNCAAASSTAGAANTGGGGGSSGGNEGSNSGKAGGSGIVVIRYRYQ